MNEIYGKDGSRYQYRPELGMILKDGQVMPTTEFEPLFVPGTLEFSGVLDKVSGKIISLTGDIGGITQN